MSNFRFFRHPREDTNLHIYARRRKKREKKKKKGKVKKKERPVEMLVITYNYFLRQLYAYVYTIGGIVLAREGSDFPKVRRR